MENPDTPGSSAILAPAPLGVQQAPPVMASTTMAAPGPYPVQYVYATPSSAVRPQTYQIVTRESGTCTDLDGEGEGDTRLDTYSNIKYNLPPHVEV